MTEYDKENITEILHGKGTWFTAELFRLIAKSDALNRAKLAIAYPHEVNVVHQHLTGKTIYEDRNLVLQQTERQQKMKLFKSNKKYQLVTKNTWGNSEISELVLEGTQAEIKAFAKKSSFAWEADDSKIGGGSFTRSIDGYRTQTYEIIEKAN